MRLKILPLRFYIKFHVSFLIKVAETRSESSDRVRATAHGSDSQPAAPVSAGDCLKPVSPDNEANAASSETLGDRTDSEPEKRPAEQESEQDTLIRQQLRSREAGSEPAVGVPTKQDQPPGPAPRRGSCEGEEKQDQSKEEPPLELKQQEG